MFSGRYTYSTLPSPPGLQLKLMCVIECIHD
jgi:hypothetical protein